MKREPSLREVALETLIAARCDGAEVPAGATLVVFAPDGQARRPVAIGAKFGGNAGKRQKEDEATWWFQPGPHAVELVPFAAAPELGLQVEFVVDAPDPRLARQRFDLFLFSEVAGHADELSLPQLTARIEAALRAALEQGILALPPCTSLDEWNAFRGGFNELLYTRFGLTVEDCVPADLAAVDFAQVLRQRAAAQLPSTPAVDAPQPAPAPQAHLPAMDDGAALRRLFLELPDATRALRQLDAPSFAVRQALLQRLALTALDVSTMPSIEWSAPRQARAAGESATLAQASAAAVRALDELWALLAQLKGGAGGDGELDRIVANLEYHLAARRGILP